MSTAAQNRIVFSDLLASDPLMPAVLVAAIRKQGEDVVKAGPTFDHGGPVSNSDWYECAQLSIKMLDADPSRSGVLGLVCSTPLTHPFIQWFAVAAVEEYGDQDPDDFQVPAGVDTGAWAAAAERAGQAMALCALWEGDTGGVSPTYSA